MRCLAYYDRSINSPHYIFHSQCSSSFAFCHDSCFMIVYSCNCPVHFVQLALSVRTQLRRKDCAHIQSGAGVFARPNVRRRLHLGRHGSLSQPHTEGESSLEKIEYSNDLGIFRLERPENTSGLYFPLVSESGLKSWIRNPFSSSP